jgi:hypothetical protein
MGDNEDMPLACARCHPTNAKQIRFFMREFIVAIAWGRGNGTKLELRAAGDTIAYDMR